ncbi:hypothetical protein OsJ_02772 [Oryza sativa Japonica Group]|uniref:Uncharacterized protein n=1 Tax=Oryza sativa subsp. japonica TaxID=39947 RepID=A2ZVV5_ORYSJ|nr:hypothetical protein OsJ_02772 [Oryza sativa Japonica Group]
MEERPRDRTVEEAAAFSGDESDGEFEFPFVSRETDAGGVADELFADGRIRAFYPVFGRVLDDVALLRSGCPGRRRRPRRRAPAEERVDGVIARWPRISELVVGRSHSDGKEKFRFLSAPSSPARDHPKPKPTTKGGAAAATKLHTELDTIAAGHRLSYSPNHKAHGGATRRTFLPYRQDLMGIFANVNGLSRTHHRPF